MKYYRRKFDDDDYLNIKKFIQNNPRISNHRNWSIDRWNFCRYFAQIMHKTYDNWTSTVGIWVNENAEIAIIVNSEGEDKGEVFFQIGVNDIPDNTLNEMFEYATHNLWTKKKQKKYINLRIGRHNKRLQEYALDKGFERQNWNELTSVMQVERKLDINIPSRFEILDGNHVSENDKGVAHAKAFGYYESEISIDSKGCYKMLKKAPDYKSGLDLYMIAPDNQVAAFCTLWHDEINNIGILEPVGTLPEFRKIGLAKALIFKCMNSVYDKGVRKIYVGSSQTFYFKLGFNVEWCDEIWKKIIT